MQKVVYAFLEEARFSVIQTATGPPVIAEGYQDNDRLPDHYKIGRVIRMESYPIRFLTARQERTEVVTRAGLVFSIYDREGVFFFKEELQ